MASIRIHFWDFCLFVDRGADGASVLMPVTAKHKPTLIPEGGGAGSGIDIRGAIISIVQNNTVVASSAPDMTPLADRVPDLDRLLGQTTLDSDKLAPALHPILLARVDLPGGTFVPQAPRREPALEWDSWTLHGPDASETLRLTDDVLWEFPVASGGGWQLKVERAGATTFHALTADLAKGRMVLANLEPCVNPGKSTYLSEFLDFAPVLGASPSSFPIPLHEPSWTTLLQMASKKMKSQTSVFSAPPPSACDPVCPGARIKPLIA